MTKLKIQILAKDIEETSYFQSTDCAITRALARAGRPDLEDSGGCITEMGEFVEIVNEKNKVYKNLNNRVISMYGYLGKCKSDKKEQPTDFEVILTFKE